MRFLALLFNYGLYVKRLSIPAGWLCALTGQNNKQVLDEVEQNIVICQWRADQLYYLLIPEAEANN